MNKRKNMQLIKNGAPQKQAKHFHAQHPSLQFSIITFQLNK